VKDSLSLFRYSQKLGMARFAAQTPDDALLTTLDTESNSIGDDRENT